MPRPHRLIAAVLVLGSLAAAGAAAAQGRPPHAGGPGFGPGFGLDFAGIDTDGDGRVSPAELQARALARLGTADTDGDGSLTRVELVALIPEPAGGFFQPFAPSRGEAFADRLLAMMGATETGTVLVIDLADRRVNDMMAALDRDRDGAISADEAERPRGRMAGRRGEHGRPRF